MQSSQMNDSTRPRSRWGCPGLALFGTLVLAVGAGCGGRATSPATDDPEASGAEAGDPETSDPDTSDPDTSSDVPDEASEEMPPAFDVLELRQLDDASAEGVAPSACDYLTRIKINMVTGTAITSICWADASGAGSSGSTSTLDPAQLDAVQSAYLQLRSSTTDKCTSRDVLTLALKLGRANARQNLLFADDEHAGCPAAGTPSPRFVSGLPELHAVLAQLLGG